MSDLVTNARLARLSTTAIDRILIVTGDYLETTFWDAILNEKNSPDGPNYWVEKGKKGNLLGTLQAYSALRGEPHSAGQGGQGSPIEQILMFFGSGTRLSPFTQSLRNIKAAFPLPDGDRGSNGLTIGEAAIRAAAPLNDCLRDAGFAGIVLTWGDQVLIPSMPLRAGRDAFAAADVVRFGWRKEPDATLATQKEWLQVDAQTGAVVRDISRQPLDQLNDALRKDAPPNSCTFVNLGSFAATEEFFSYAADAFGDRVDDPSSTANWDPYFWAALQASSLDAWNELLRSERQAGLSGLQTLLEGIPDFYSITQTFKTNFERRVGRPIHIAVLDFGEPYWIDVGNHHALSSALADMFSSSEHGSAIREFLGLPESLSSGASFVANSILPPDCVVENSIVIGTAITGQASSIRGSVVLGSRIGRLVADRGTSAVWCRADDLRLNGPHGFAFRLDSPSEIVNGDESATTLLLPDRVLNLKYSRNLGSIDRRAFESRLGDNPVSFAEAASLVGSMDPVDLHRTWAARLAAH